MGMVTRQSNKSAQYDEIVKCAEDPIYFIKTYQYIQHPVKGRLPFRLFPFQEDVIKDYLQYKYNIILKSRQLGLSTATAAYALWLALFHRDQNIIVMATKLETGKFIIQKIRTAFKMLPAWMLEMLQLSEPATESTKYISFTNGSKITAIPTAQDAGRGESCSLLILDECAHIENLGTLWAGLRPMLSTGGRAILFSSPLGKGNFFHDLWIGADTGDYVPNKPGFHATSTGKNGFHAIKLPWMVHPERDDKWFEEESKAMDVRTLSQELICSFESSGQTYFNQVQIDWVKSMCQTPVAFIGPKGVGGDLWIWKTPVGGRNYVICADVSRGDADDFSAFHVIDTVDCDVAAEYLGKIPTDEYAEFLMETGKRYNTALIVQEKNTFGVAVANIFRAKQYPNLWYSPEIKEKMQFMSIEEQAKQIPGFETSGKNREPALQNLEELIRNKKFRFYSTRFVEELEHFIWTGKRGQALRKKHDDLILSAAIGLQVFTPNGTSLDSVNADGLAWQMAFLKSISRSNSTMSTNVGDYGSSPQAALSPFANQARPQRGVERFQGKQLPPGVRAENVEMDWLLRNEFDWLLR